MKNLLEGKKTYIIAGLIFVLGGLKALGLIDDNTYKIAFDFLLPAGLVSLRASIK